MEKEPEWSHIFTSKEECEAYCYAPKKEWHYGGIRNGAIKSTTLNKAMSYARICRRNGVRVISYDKSSGDWIIIKEYPANLKKYHQK